jgi:hypothetical protein
MTMKKILLLFILFLCVSTFVFSGDDDSTNPTDTPPIPPTGIHVEITVDE